MVEHLGGGGLANQVPGLTTFQVVQDKTNSINMNPSLQFAHRLMKISVCILGLIDSELQSLRSHTQTRHAAWDLFLNGSPDVL